MLLPVDGDAPGEQKADGYIVTADGHRVAILDCESFDAIFTPVVYPSVAETKPPDPAPLPDAPSFNNGKVGPKPAKQPAESVTSKGRQPDADHPWKTRGDGSKSYATMVREGLSKRRMTMEQIQAYAESEGMPADKTIAQTVYTLKQNGEIVKNDPGGRGEITWSIAE